MATRGQGPCLYLYPTVEWDKVLARLERQKVRVDPEQRRQYLQLMQFTAEAPLDGQGRIHLPQHLAALAGIQRDVVFVGAGDVIEMWDPIRHGEYVGGTEADFDGWLAKFL